MPPRRRRPRALTNNRYSADVIAVASARDASRATCRTCRPTTRLPRWLAEVAGVPVDDLRDAGGSASTSTGRSTSSCSAADGRHRSPAPDARRCRAMRSPASATVARPAAELVVAGRVSAANLAWLEAHTASRTRALVEERGLRTRRAGPAAGRLGARRAARARRAGRRSATTSAGSATPRSSTRACCWPIASARTRPPGRRRGSLRVRPAAARPDRRPVAARR